MIKYQSGYSDGDQVQKSNSTYLDPQTKTTYVWDSTRHEWKPQYYPDNYRYTDQQSGVTYKWKAQEQKWEIIENEKKESNSSEEKKDATENKESAPSVEEGRILCEITNIFLFGL